MCAGSCLLRANKALANSVNARRHWADADVADGSFATDPADQARYLMSASLQKRRPDIGANEQSDYQTPLA
jgi:hypothetical protein